MSIDHGTIEIQTADGDGSPVKPSGDSKTNDRLTELKHFEKGTGQGLKQTYSIHGEQAAKRRAVGELIFFAGR